MVSLKQRPPTLTIQQRPRFHTPRVKSGYGIKLPSESPVPQITATFFAPPRDCSRGLEVARKWRSSSSFKPTADPHPAFGCIVTLPRQASELRMNWLLHLGSAPSCQHPTVRSAGPKHDVVMTARYAIQTRKVASNDETDCNLLPPWRISGGLCVSCFCFIQHWRNFERSPDNCSADRRLPLLVGLQSTTLPLRRRSG